MKKIVLLMAAAVCMLSCGNKQTQTTEQDAERVEVVSTMTLVPQTIERVLQVSTNLSGLPHTKCSAFAYRQDRTYLHRSGRCGKSW